MTKNGEGSHMYGWRKTFPAVAALVALAGIPGGYFLFREKAIAVPVHSANSSVPLHVDRAFTRVTLELPKNASQHFLLTDSADTVRAWAKKRDASKDAGCHVIATNPALGLACTAGDRELTIDIQSSTGGESRYRDLYLIPYRILEPTQILVSTLEISTVKFYTAGRTIHIAALDCAGGSKSECSLVDEFVGKAPVVLLNDPQRAVASWVRWFAEHCVPGVIGLMAVTVFGLFVMIGVLLSRCLRRQPYQDGLPGAQSQDIFHAESRERWKQQVLDVLATSGPLVGFSLTVVALIDAFAGFGDQSDQTLTQSIGLAMTATVLGIAIRLQSFWGHHLITYLCSWDADPNGIVDRRSTSRKTIQTASNSGADAPPSGSKHKNGSGSSIQHGDTPQ